MALLSTQVEVIPKGKMIPYYKNKGYIVFYNTPLIVKMLIIQITNIINFFISVIPPFSI